MCVNWGIQNGSPCTVPHTGASLLNRVDWHTWDSTICRYNCYSSLARCCHCRALEEKVYHKSDKPQPLGVSAVSHKHCEALVLIMIATGIYRLVLHPLWFACYVICQPTGWHLCESYWGCKVTVVWILLRLCDDVWTAQLTCWTSRVGSLTQQRWTDTQTDTNEKGQTNAHAECVTGKYKLTCWTSKAPTTLLLPVMPTYLLRSSCWANVPAPCTVLPAAAATR